MGQPASNKIINPKQWKEVLSNQTYIMNIFDCQIHCNGCGNLLRKGERITRLLTNEGDEYYHYDKCLKGVEIVGENPS